MNRERERERGRDGLAELEPILVSRLLVAIAMVGPAELHPAILASMALLLAVGHYVDL